MAYPLARVGGTIRLEGANAAVARGTANVEETTLVVLRTAAAAYFRILHAQERIRLLGTTQIFTLLVLPTFYRQVHGWLDRPTSKRQACVPSVHTA